LNLLVKFKVADKLISSTVKKDIAFVLVQFALFALYIIDVDVIAYSIDLPAWINIILIITGIFGVMIITMGIINLSDNLTPFPTPRKNSNLISEGIYKYVRHPIYTGIVFIMFAFGFYTTSFTRMIITIILFLVFYFKSELEEKLLIDKFPEYRDYQKRSGRFFPRLGKK
jgi:protein-S-isoprenylcysteine O-methyltransferase Ste14